MSEFHEDFAILLKQFIDSHDTSGKENPALDKIFTDTMYKVHAGQEIVKYLVCGEKTKTTTCSLP